MTKTYFIEITEEQYKKAEQWKAIADEYNLTINELRKIASSIEQIKKITEK